MSLHVSDHALLRFLERAGALDVEAIRRLLAASLARAAKVAQSLDQGEYAIKKDGMVYVVIDGRVVTIMEDPGHAIIVRRPA